MSTALVLTHHLRENTKTAEPFLLCGSSLSDIIEETEYIKTIRSTLAKVQPVLYKKELNHSIANGTLDSKLHVTESGLVPEEEVLASNNEETLKRINKVEEELVWVNKENERLKMKQSTDSLSQLSAQLNEKYGQIEELEKRVQRMEEEKKTLDEKKQLLKKKLHRMMSKAENARSCVKVQSEMCVVQEQITHLDRVIHSQHQHLHNLIHQV
ncbi:hypothetical protein E2320_017838 [Naja naja]|nr:hypothetical protein E2320_017838 [Naja naja]